MEVENSRELRTRVARDIELVPRWSAVEVLVGAFTFVEPSDPCFARDPGASERLGSGSDATVGQRQHGGAPRLTFFIEALDDDPPRAFRPGVGRLSALAASKLVIQHVKKPEGASR